MKKFLFVIAASLLINVVYSQCNPVSTFPWKESFENNGTEIPLCWTHLATGEPDWKWTVVPNTTGIPSTAHEGNYKARSYYSGTVAWINNSKLITPVFNLSTLNKPVLIFWYTQRERGNLRVKYRRSSEEEWKVYLHVSSFNIPEWHGEIILLPNKSEYYQIAFENVISGTNTSEIQLDNITIMEFADIVDVELNKIITPASGENLTNSEPVKVLLKNNGSDPLTGFALQLELNGSLITTETFMGSIPSLGQIEYTFATTLNLSAETTYQIKVTAIAESDLISSNNSKIINVKNIICPKITSFPWQEGFEDYGANIPKCWNQEGYGWQWTVVPASTGTPPTAHGGSYKARIYENFAGAPAYSAKLITPVLDLSNVNVPVLNFWHTEVERGNLRVYYKNSSSGNWALLKSFSKNPEWKTEFLLLPNKSDYYQIAFESTFAGGGHYEAQLDDIRVMDFVDFVDVELLSIITPITGVNHTNNETVKVLVKNNSSASLTGFKLQLELGGALIATETYTESIPSLEQAEYTFNATLNLSAEATYQIKVTAIATGDQIHDNNSKTVFINNYVCSAITSFPWTEGFEYGPILNPYPCWEQEIVTGNFDWRITKPTYGLPPTTHSGDYMAWLFNSSYYGVHKARLITPVFNLSAIHNPVLSFWYTQHDNWYYQEQDILRVYYKNSPSENWILLKAFLDDVPTWQEESIELPNPSSYYQIAFEGEVGRGNGVNLDDISISGEVSISSYHLDNYSLTPNPVQDILTVTRPDATKITVAIYNSMGALVHSFETSETELKINVSNYSAGVYLIRLSDGNAVATKRFVKQ
ncbi:MAG: choice-of-anchor J domain-containing protein [Bacteroidetes bacterium]|nr:choice-of-anchor J domain-containing protein [Bacteroidota bacterium]MCL2302814.1 choice-of-anchor J domain-containing protein [Lentimicrobiaceae bacterium]